jgi:hypothetical protein
MAIIYSYPQYAPKPEDLLIGTVTLDENAAVPIYDNPTVSFTIQSLLDMIAPITGAQNLQQVTNIGATTSNAVTFTSDIKVTGRFYDSSGSPGLAGQVLSSTVAGTSWIVNSPASVTSVGLAMPAAFTVANSPITTAGVLTVTGAGTALQYINGLGNLVTFPTIPTPYVLPLAANGTRGGIQIGYTSAGKNYAVQLSSEKAFVNVPWTDTPYVLPVATNAALGGIKIGYTDNAKNYALELDTDSEAFVNVPWTDTVYTLPLAADGTRGGVQIGYAENAKNYPVELDSEKMFVNVPWTDTQNPFQTITGTGSDNTDSGIILSDSGGTVLILGSGSVTAAQSGNTITLTGVNTWVANSLNVAGYVAAPGAVASKVWKTDASGNPAWRDDADTDTGITSVTLAVNSAGTWTVPLSESITGRELTLTSNVYGGGSKVGFVPAAGTATTFLRGDGSWGAIPTGLQFKDTWSAAGTGGGNPDLTVLSPADGWLYIVDVAGSAAPNGSGVAPNSWNLGDWCIYNGTAWTRVPATNSGVTTVTTTDGTYVDLTPNTATTGAVTVTADLSAVDGTSDTNTRFLSKDNTWDVPSYTTDNNTTYTVDVPSTTTSINLAGSDGSNDAIVLTGGTNVTLSRTDASTIDIAATDTNTQNEYANSWVQSTNDILLRLTESGAGSGTQDIKIVKGANITFTYTDANNFTIAATDTQENTTWYIRDSADADKTVNNLKYLKFVTATGTLGTALTGTGTTSDPYLMTLTSPDTNTQNTYTAGTGLGLSSFEFSANVNATAQSTQPEAVSTDSNRTYAVQVDDTNDKLVVNVPWSSGGTYSWKVRDNASTPVNKTLSSGEFLQFKTATGALATGLAGTGTTTDPYVMTLTSPNDNTTYDVMGSGNSYAAGLVLTGSATNGGNFLRKDGTWQVPPNTQYSDFVSSTAGAVGTAGLVPAPAAGTQGGTYYLNGDASFSVPPDTNTWVANAVTVAGYVAAPSATDANLVWKTNGSGEPAWRVDADTQPITYTISVAAPGSNNTNVTITPSTGTASTIQLTAGTFIKTTPAAASAQTTLDLSASGTASSSTFLRGDNAWATPPNDDTQYTAGTGLSLSNEEFSIDSTVVTKTGTQTLTNKTLTSPVIDEIVPSGAILTIKGDGSSVDAKIKLNCWNNNHGQTLSAQPHSAGVTNTMLLPAGSSSTLVSEVSTSTLTNKSGSNSQWTNDEGYITSAANYYLDGITKAGNVLTFSVSGTTNQTYTFGANAFNSTTIPTDNNQITNGAGYITSYTETDDLADVTGRGASTTTACSFTNTTSFTVGSSGTGSVYIGNTATSKFARFHTNNTDTYYDMNCGDVLWRQSSNTRFKFDMTSAVFTCAGDIVAFGTPSDKRLKENIKPIESALEKAIKLQGVTFDWKKSDSELNIKEDIGFIAQDVQKVVPELVRENENGMLSMRHQGIAPILLEAIKELKNEIEELKKHKCNCNK